VTLSVTPVRPIENPFASNRIESLDFRFYTGGLEELIARLRRRRGRGAVVGPHGSGKTTLLDLLADRLAGETTWIRLDAESAPTGPVLREQLPTTVGPHHTVVFDGAEQLSCCQWWSFRRRLRRAGVLLVSSHRTGRLPTLYECSTSPKLLSELVRELSPETLGAVDLEALFQRHGGDIRACFRELYDLWAGRSA
jgi:ABC-type branched-subunit amino acid transport system ATPase component